MRALYTLLAIITVMVGSAQTPRTTVAVVTEFSNADGSYLNLKGGNNPEENCFDEVTRGDAYTIWYQANGLDVNIDIDNTRYKVLDNDRSYINGNVNRWASYNRIYEVRDNADPRHIEYSDLLDCPEGRNWEQAPNNVQWFISTNPAFSGWAYNEYIDNGLYKAYLTDDYRGFSASLNQEYITNNLFSDVGYGNLASLEAAIETFISSRSTSVDVTWTEVPNLSASGNPLGFLGRSTVGAHRYEITHAIQYGASVPERHGMGWYIEGSWIYHGGPNGGGSSDPNTFYRIDTPSYYYYSTQGRRLTTEEETTFGEEGIQSRINIGAITVQYEMPNLQQITDAQTIVRQLILTEFNAFAVSQVSGQ